MFSPISQTSIPSLPSSHSLPHSFLPSLLSIILEFYSNNLVSIESGAFNGLNNLLYLSFPSLPQSPHLQSLPSFLFHPSTLVITLSPPFHLMYLMAFPLSRISSFPLFFFSLSYHSLKTLIPTVSPPFLQVFLKVLTMWALSFSISLSFSQSILLFLFSLSITTN